MNDAKAQFLRQVKKWLVASGLGPGHWPPLLEEIAAALESDVLAEGWTRPDIALRLKQGFSVMVSPTNWGTATQDVTIRKAKP